LQPSRAGHRAGRPTIRQIKLLKNNQFNEKAVNKMLHCKIFLASRQTLS
jgi:hypothetical protein